MATASVPGRPPLARDAAADVCVAGGGIAALPCQAGYTCKLDGTYPDAGGTCVKS